MPITSNESFAKPVSDNKALAANEINTTKPVPVSVDLRVKVTNKMAWITRRSYHLESDVKYSELDDLLSQDHSRNEARYTPSVYDANELLTWSHEDLEKAVNELNRDGRIQSIEMSGKDPTQDEIMLYSGVPSVLALPESLVISKSITDVL